MRKTPFQSVHKYTHILIKRGPPDAAVDLNLGKRYIGKWKLHCTQI